jgi:MFS family permease
MGSDGSPRRVYYGWYVLAVVALGAFLSASTAQLFMSTMLLPMSEELGWSRTAATGAVTAGTLAGGALSPWVGRLVDRYGPRPLTAIGALVVAAAQFLLAALDQLWQLYATYIVGRAVASTTLAGVVPSTAATNWFRRRRGRALGLVAMAIPLGVSALALGAQAITERFGWRAVFVAYGAATALVLAPLAALVLRRRPEDLGLRPDGEPAPAAPHGASGAAGGRAGGDEEASWSLAEARRTRALWLLIAASALGVLANTAVGFHQLGYYTGVGLAPAEAVLALSVYSLAGALASGLWGWLTERFPERPLAALVMVLAALSVAYLLLVRDLVGALVFAVAFGVTSRGEGTLTNIIVAQYFGRRAYGSIQGFIYPFTMLGLGAGPVIGSLGLDLTGSYTAVLGGGTAAFLLTAVLFWLARKPTRPPRARAERRPAG